jgi:hypothetical protein
VHEVFTEVLIDTCAIATGEAALAFMPFSASQDATDR